MSKLYQLLIETAETHKVAHNHPFCEITAFADGEIFVNVGGERVAKGKWEDELIVSLSRYLVSRRETVETRVSRCK